MCMVQLLENKFYCRSAEPHMLATTRMSLAVDCTVVCHIDRPSLQYKSQMVFYFRAIVASSFSIPFSHESSRRRREGSSAGEYGGEEHLSLESPLYKDTNIKHTESPYTNLEPFLEVECAILATI